MKAKSNALSCFYIAGHTSPTAFISLLKRRTGISLQLLKTDDMPAVVFFAEVPYLFTTIYMIDNTHNTLSRAKNDPPLVGVLICTGEGASETAQMIKDKLHTTRQFTIANCPPPMRARAMKILEKTISNA